MEPHRRKDIQGSYAGCNVHHSGKPLCCHYCHSGQRGRSFESFHGNANLQWRVLSGKGRRNTQCYCRVLVPCCGCHSISTAFVTPHCVLSPKRVLITADSQCGAVISRRSVGCPLYYLWCLWVHYHAVHGTACIVAGRCCCAHGSGAPHHGEGYGRSAQNGPLPIKGSILHTGVYAV